MSPHLRRLLPWGSMLLLVALAAFLLGQQWWDRAPLDDAPQFIEQGDIRQAAGGPRLEGGAGMSAAVASLGTGVPVDGEGAELRVECVADATGDTIEGALVFTSSEDRPFAHRSTCVTTADDGTATLVPARGHALLHGLACGYLPATTALRLKTGAYQLRMVRGRSVDGRVLDSGGRGIAGAFVTAFHPMNRAGFGGLKRAAMVYGGMQGAGATARTDGDGRFVLHGLPDAAMTIWAAQNGWYPKPPMVRLRKIQDRVEIRLVPVTVVTLRFIDAVTGDPIAPFIPRTLVSIPQGMITLPLQWANANALLAGTSVEDGVGARTYVIVPDNSTRGHSPVSGHVEVQAGVLCPGYERTKQRFELELGSRSTQVIRLKRLTRTVREVAVRATFIGGNAYTGALQVDIFQQDTGPSGYAVLEFVDGKSKKPLRLPEGRYTLYARGCFNDPTLSQEFWNPAGQKVHVDLLSGSGVIECEILLAGEQVTLEVVDARGVPVRGYSLGLDRDGKMERGEVFAWDVHGVVRQGTATVLPHIWLPPGDMTLRVHLPGVGRGSTRLQVGRGGLESRCLVRLK